MLNTPSSPRIFLTGATGVLGARLLKDLLAQTKAQVTCLVRANSEVEGADRIRTFLGVYDPDNTLVKEFQERVSIVLGDISIERLGLTESAYQTLAQKTDTILHAAASTNLFLSYRRIEPINVVGVKNMIEFALLTKPKRLHYISTFTVIGDKLYDPTVTFTENKLDIGQGFLDMTYQRSKFVAENLIREAEGRGLLWNIYRPGQIFGDSKTGAYPSGQTNVSGLFLDIFKTVIETGVAFHSDGKFDLTPVDYVSNAIVYLALTRDAPSETYHLMNPHPKSYTEVIDLLRKEGYAVRYVLQDEYKAMLEDESMNYKSTTTKAFKSWLSRSNFDFRTTAEMNAAFTVAILKKAGIECPPIDQALMHTYVTHGIRQGYFPKPNL